MADDDFEPGWYLDPSRPGLHRYWTGSRWQPQGERLEQDETTAYAAAADEDDPAVPRLVGSS